MSVKNISIIGSYKTKNTVEKAAGIIFKIFALFTVAAVFSITLPGYALH